MELAGYWNIDDADLRRQVASLGAECLLDGDGWAIVAVSSGNDDTDMCIPVLDETGARRGLVVGRLASGRGQDLPSRLRTEAFTTVAGAGALTELVWGSYTAATVVGSGHKGRLLAGGDPIGLRSCFWTRHRGGFVFASRMADLADFLGYQPGFDWDHLRGFLVHGELPVSTTGLAGINTVRAGTRIELDSCGTREHLVWSPFTFAASTGPRPSHEGLRRLVSDCVDKRAGEAETVYVELSGGLDSAVVAQALTASGRRVVGGHFHHGGSALADELDYARGVARLLGIEVEVIDVAEALPFTPVPGAGRRWDAPTGHLAWESLPGAHRRVAAEHGCTVSMSGAGGDHVFVARSGVPLYLHDYLLRLGLRSTLRDMLAFSRVRGVPLARLLADLGQWEAARRRGSPALLARILGEAESPAWLTRPAPAAGPHAVEDLIPASARLTAGKMGQALEMTLLACAVGTRHATVGPDRTVFPLLSQPLVELGLSTGMEALISATTDRILIRDAMAGLLPADLLARRDKGEHTATWQRGLRANIGLARDLVADGAAAAAGIIDPAPALAAVSAAALGHTGRLWPLLNLLSVELWIQSWTSAPQLDERESGPGAERTRLG
jgi:asparagine synthase (glutamine-hydrolysing)